MNRAVWTICPPALSLTFCCYCNTQSCLYWLRHRLLMSQWCWSLYSYCTWQQCTHWHLIWTRPATDNRFPRSAVLQEWWEITITTRSEPVAPGRQRRWATSVFMSLQEYFSNSTLYFYTVPHLQDTGQQRMSKMHEANDAPLNQKPLIDCVMFCPYKWKTQETYSVNNKYYWLDSDRLRQARCFLI